MIEENEWLTVPFVGKDGNVYFNKMWNGKFPKQDKKEEDNESK